MSIANDAWIRKMAREHGMIEPFQDGQVAKGKISYGVSSYGYDVRVGRHFKIFHNVHATLVDPKAFDQKSFFDHVGDECIIPPNSFALAETVERFRVPRNVLCVCLGKSTYARCFTGDTRVALVDGTAPTLEEMARGAEAGDTYFGYSVGEHGRIIVTHLDRPRWIARDAVIELTLDSGERIRCTNDHVFLRRDGSTAPAHELRPGDSLMPLYRGLVRGYESVYQPLNGHLIPTHRLADEWNLRNRVYEEAPGTHRHHVDHDRRNNAPWNIRRVPSSDHIRHHNDENYGLGFDPAEHGRSIQLALAQRAEDPAWRARFAAAQAARAREFWTEDRYATAREALRARNHKITAIRDIPGEHDVYCLTVPEAGNFALEAGVFVRNCGIIVNVTPLEPEWEGVVTIEISNTTPLPAKIYANEGIAQILFFLAAPDGVCETSYKDRKGKYQNQAGLTLPKIAT